MEPSTQLVREMFVLTQGNVPIVGVGGVRSADDAYRKIRAGASLVQVYTEFVFRGPLLVHEIKTGLEERLRRDGFRSVGEAVGADAKEELAAAQAQQRGAEAR